MDYADYDWYTVTLDYMATGEGHTRAIWIGRANGEQAAKDAFARHHGTYFALGAEVKRGLQIENGFADLLTEYAKKILLRLKSNNPDAPGGFAYANIISVNYC